MRHQLPKRKKCKLHFWSCICWFGWLNLEGLQQNLLARNTNIREFLDFSFFVDGGESKKCKIGTWAPKLKLTQSISIWLEVAGLLPSRARMLIERSEMQRGLKFVVWQIYHFGAARKPHNRNFSLQRQALWNTECTTWSKFKLHNNA